MCEFSIQRCPNTFWMNVYTYILYVIMCMLTEMLLWNINNQKIVCVCFNMKYLFWN